jgi:Papain-like cysteine protease AvrRpt2
LEKIDSWVKKTTTLPDDISESSKFKTRRLIMNLQLNQLIRADKILTIEGGELTAKEEKSHKRQQNQLLKRLIKSMRSSQVELINPVNLDNSVLRKNNSSKLKKDSSEKSLDNNSVGSIENTTGRHNINLTLPVILQNNIIKYGHSDFLDKIGNKVVPLQRFQKETSGLCWAASMAMMGPINTSYSVPSYANWIHDNPDNSKNLTEHFFIDGNLKFTPHLYLKAMDSMLKAYAERDAFAHRPLAITQGLIPAVPNDNPKLTPKILNELLSKNNTGVLAAYRTINGKMINDGDIPTTGHAVVLTGVKNDKVIYNDPNIKDRQAVTFKQFNMALNSTRYALLVKDKATIVPSVDINSTNQYIGKINLEKSSNEEIFQHIKQASTEHTINIVRKTALLIKKDPKNNNKIVEDAANFMKFLVQVDEVVRLRYNIAIQENLITTTSVQPDITALPLPASFSELRRENNKNIKILEKKLGELQVPYKNLLDYNDKEMLIFLKR